MSCDVFISYKNECQFRLEAAKAQLRVAKAAYAQASIDYLIAGGYDATQARSIAWTLAQRSQQNGADPELSRAANRSGMRQVVLAIVSSTGAATFNVHKSLFCTELVWIVRFPYRQDRFVVMTFEEDPRAQEKIEIRLPSPADPEHWFI